PRLDKKIFIFVDESHFDKNWAVSGKIIYDKTKNIFLICTGSSSIDLEINGDVARRSIKESIFPNNFNDYLLLKHNFKINSDFSNSLKNVLYYGDENYIEKAVNLEKEVYNNLFDLKKDIDIEFIEFLKSFGFPLTLNHGELRRYRRNFAVVNQVIERDIPLVQSFNTSSNNNIKKIIYYLALAREGETSNQKIADYLSISPKMVNEILNVLEKTQLIFSIKPYGGAGKIVRKQWKYYFLSPTLTGAINYYIGRFDLNNRTCLGKLAETFVASTLFKMSQSFHLLDIFYPTAKKTSDFIIRTKFNNLVPIEVGIGKKTKSQLTITMNKYGADKGILISNRYNRIRYENNILYLPLISFGFI
ncbi:MAG: AAA family ATPase, partial [Methanobrevibacter sp.]|nr:AAA family ATPase [Candidatus Methanoflexus mossambicus]